ncbi:MAG: DNA polymerase I [Chroococcopsis gigantea SAG 12.99]|jgi:DNA polymerase-1|nr:DNA polymerase I [Chlorogloea purpurea SAG 13.99]MDV2998580.1 DNA polymerase I [Chroococcopsis gigantea SAG 12.99]
MAQTPVKPLLVLIDGHSLAFRSFYAFKNTSKGLLRTSAGIPTSICFGFVNSLLQLLQFQMPQYLAVAFDLSTPSFRHENDANYKANRKDTPEDFIPDIKNLKLLLSAFNIPVITAEGYEADDVLGTLAIKASQEGFEVKILTGDRDLFQLVDDEQKISILYLDAKAFKTANVKGYIEFNEAAVEEKMGVKATQIVDYKALCGDKSDNIKGVSGIGDKTAISLLKQYGSLDNIYENIPAIGGAVKTKLINGKADAIASKFLAQIALDVPIDRSLDSFCLRGFDPDEVQKIFQELELKSFSKKLDYFHQHLGGIKYNPDSPFQSQQLSIFPAEVETVIQNAGETGIQPAIIQSLSQLQDLIEVLKNYTDKDYAPAWDTETTSLNPMEAHLVGIGCCWGEGRKDMAYIPLNHKGGDNLPIEEALSLLKLILESEDYPKCLQNAKFDRRVLKHQGIQLRGVVFDTMLAGYVLHPELTHNLQDLCDRYLTGIKSQSYQELKLGKSQTIADLDISAVALYCGMDVYATFHLGRILRRELSEIEKLQKLLVEVELPLEIVLAGMEDDGVSIDKAYLNELSEKLAVDLKVIEEKTYELAGEQFNLGSPKKLSEILFDKLGLSTKKSRKTKTGYSTDHTILEKLQGDHPIIDYILENRTLSKLKSTYVDALPSLVSPKTGRIHTEYNQAVTATGRLSSSNPNLQNIPIRTKFSRKIRQAFIPDDGYILVSADYSQVELRILAHLSQEPVLLNAYQNNEDIHRVTAQILFDKTDITSQERNMGKTINFGVIYGMGYQKFARQVKVSNEEGRRFVEKYHRQYARIFEYLDGVKKQAIAKGYVETILGRRRYFQFNNPRLQELKGMAEEDIDLDQLHLSFEDAQFLRAAANAPIQGSSADIIKIAMIKIDEILREYEAKLLLQVHDELVFEVPVGEWERLQPLIKSTMEEAVSLSVPLVVDVTAGKNWMEAK